MNDKQKVELPVVAWGNGTGGVLSVRGKAARMKLHGSGACDEYNEPLTTVAHAESYARAMVDEFRQNLQGCMEALASYSPDCIEVECAAALLSKLGEKGNE